MIYSPDFNSGILFSFSEYSGDTSKISSYAELAKYMYCSAIDYANYLFKYYVTPTGSYSMADFGFSGT